MLNHINAYGEMFGGQDVDWAYTSGIEFDMYENVLWREPNDVSFDQHELQQLPNGNYMGFVHEFKDGPIPLGNWTNQFQSIGYIADGITNEIDWVGQNLVEIDSSNNQVVWSWNPFDYYSFDEYDSLGGTWNYVASSGRNYFDWLHSNAFFFDAEKSEIYISHRHLSRVTKISYPSGEVIWEMGPNHELLNYGENHICSEIGFNWQHHIQLLENGNLLLFDNGNLSHYINDEVNPQTRILEIRIDGSYECEVVWEYKLPYNLLTLGRGSVQLIENGNYLIIAGNDNILEISKDKEVIWQADLNTIAIYRSYKIPSLFPDAFSINFKNITEFYEIEETNSINYFLLGDEIIFEISNLSKYSNEYEYQISFNNETINEIVYLGSEEKKEISIPIPNAEDYIIGGFDFEIYPSKFPDKIKNYKLQYFYNENTNLNEFEIITNYPNPFNNFTEILINIPINSEIQFSVFNLVGQKLFVQYMFLKSGFNKIKWNSEKLPSGKYIVEVKTGEILVEFSILS